MMTESEIKLARYKATEKEADAMGRVIEVRRLKPSEQTKLSGMTAELSGFDEAEITDETTGQPRKIQISHRTPLLVAAAVSGIDGVHIPFPRSRGELDAIYDRLDAEGITAAMTAISRLAVKTEMVTEPVEEAKNL
jgi:hypothetical protein